MRRIGDRGEMEAFVCALDTGSFSAAARKLLLTPSAVSKLVSRLEDALGVRLVTRSPRRVAATPEGARFAARCREILAELEAAEQEAAGPRGAPRGKLRLHAGLGFGFSQLVPAIPSFCARYPEVCLDLVLEDRAIDLREENVDVSVWAFPRRLEDDHVVRKLFDYDRFLVASPAYLARYGTPRTPEDLANHRCSVVSGVPLQSPWVFEVGGERIEHAVQPALVVNNAEAKYRLVLAGMAIGQFSDYIVAAALQRRELVRVLPEYHRAARLCQFALYPHERHRMPRVSAMVDFLAQTFRRPQAGAKAAALEIVGR